MLKTFLMATVVALTGLMVTAQAASAGNYIYSGYGVYVNVNGHHHVRRHAVRYLYAHPRHYYTYADGYQYPGYHSYVRHYHGSTYAYGAPGVSVFVGSGGGLSVSVGF